MSYTNRQHTKREEVEKMTEEDVLCKFFHGALQLNNDWIVEKVELDSEQKCLAVWIAFARGVAFECPNCGIKTTHLHGSDERIFQHLNFFENKTVLHVTAPRIDCPHCMKSQTVYPPYLCRKDSGFTLLFQCLLMKLAKAAPVSLVAQIMGITAHRVARLAEKMVQTAMVAQDYSAVRKVGVDETSFAKGHKYITNFVDMETGQLLLATRGKSKEALGAFRDALEAHKGSAEQIEEFTSDMSEAFISGVKEYFPKARLTLDKFHLVKLVNDAVDKVRREESRTFKTELCHTRYLWLKNTENLTAAQAKQLEEIRLHHRRLKTVRAWRIRMAFQDVFDAKTREEGTALLKQWYWWASHSRLEPLKAAARTIKKHYDNVKHWFETRMTNGLLEGINSLIQAAKAQARGFRNISTMITVSYLRLGHLNFELPE